MNFDQNGIPFHIFKYYENKSESGEKIQESSRQKSIAKLGVKELFTDYQQEEDKNKRISKTTRVSSR